jgi:hypothetical protein
VPTEEIIEWFCQGFGSGEIDLAYSLEDEAYAPVGQVFSPSDRHADQPPDSIG